MAPQRPRTRKSARPAAGSCRTLAHARWTKRQRRRPLRGGSKAMVPGWVGTSMVRTFQVDSSGQSILTRQVPGETDVLVWRRMVDYAARWGAGSWPQTAALYRKRPDGKAGAIR